MLVEPADISSEAAELALGLFEAVEPADVSYEVAELSSGLVEALEPADVSSEVAASSHTAPQAAVPAHKTPGALPFSHFLLDSEPAQFREPKESTQRAREAAAVSTHGPSALPAPPWHPCLPLSPGPLPLHGPGAPHPSPSSAPLCRSPCWAIGNIWKPFLFFGAPCSHRDSRLHLKC